MKSALWIPAFAGMTEVGAEIAGVGAGMTIKGAREAVAKA